MVTPRLRTACAVCVVGLAAAGAWGDQITLRLSYGTVRITDVKDCRIHFRLLSGRAIVGATEEIKSVSVDGFAALDVAEKLMARRKYADAVDAYAEAAKARIPASKEWLRRLISHRQMVAAAKAGRIDLAVSAWLIIMDGNKASANAIQLRPALPKTKRPENDKAIEILATREDHALAAYRNAVNPFRMKLLQLQGRSEEAAKLADKISGDAFGTGQGRVAFISKIEAAEQYLKAGQLEKVIGALTPLLGKFNESELIRALTALGTAQWKLGKGLTGDQRKEMLCRAGVNFMRIAAMDVSSGAEKAEALYMTAQVNESFKKPNRTAARKCYERIISAYGKSPSAAKAKEALDRLSKAA